MPSSYLNSAGTQRWRATWRDASGVQRQRNFDDRESAANHEKQMVAEREAAHPTICARGGCGERVVQPPSGRRRIYCPECQRISAHERTTASHQRLKAERGPKPRRPPVVCAWGPCETMVEQPITGRPAKFCSDPHRDAYHNAQRPREYPPGGYDEVRHMLSEVDLDTRVGVCSQCGSVEVQPAGLGPGGTIRFRCPTAIAERASVQSPKPHSDPTHARVLKLRSRGIDITREVLEAMEARAGGCCELCNKRTALHLHHNYRTAQPVALLCITCNTGLGKFGDDPDRLQDATDLSRDPAAYFAAKANATTAARP